MNEDEIERLADLLFDKIMQRQEEADAEYAEQIQKLVNEGYIISDQHVEKFKDELGLDDEERLVGELARLQTIMMIFEGKEEYEKAAMIQKKIRKINKRLNNGSGKY
tara:strand:+ start:440 stop:760 length:321 start_codon:yes stop_codon:yes gene_type:complete